jgi:acetyl-CoA C-acetyltransferase
MTHSIAQMSRELRADPGSIGMVSGVGMTMTKHAYGVYSTTPGTVMPPDAAGVQAELDGHGTVAIADTWRGEAEVAAYSVVHGRDGEPEWALLVCDVDGDARAYARSTEPELLDRAESEELVGQRVRLEPTDVELASGSAQRNVAGLSA